MGRSRGLFFGKSFASVEDEPSDSAAMAFVWDSLSMSKKKRCLSTVWPQASGSAARLKSNKTTENCMIWYETKELYHLESDVNSG
jgi:hypothetical protein